MKINKLQEHLLLILESAGRSSPSHLSMLLNMNTNIVKSTVAIERELNKLLSVGLVKTNKNLYELVTDPVELVRKKNTRGKT